MANRIDPSWFQTFEQLDPANSGALIEVHQNILKKAAIKTSLEECWKIENILNNILKEQKKETINGKTIGQLIAERMKSEDLIQEKGISVNENLGVTSKAVGKALKEYKEKLNEYKKTVSELEMKISDPPKEVEDAFKIFISEQNRLNKTRGDVFEGFVKLSMETIKKNVTDLENASIDTLLKDLKESLSVNKKLKTTGSDLVRTGKTGSLSQGKIDVSISMEGPLKEEWNITAKSYGSLKDISLLRDGNAAEIIGVWPASDQVKNYYRNAISVYAPGEKGINLFLKEAEKAIGIQSLVSHKGTLFANYLILYIRNRKEKPISVIPIYKYIEKLLMNQEENPFIIQFQTRFNNTTTSKIPALSKGQDRSPKVAEEVYENLRIKKAALKSSYLTIKKLKELGLYNLT